MASYRQGNGSWQVGIAPFGTTLRAQDHGDGDQKLSIGGRHGSSSRYVEASNRTAMRSNRGKRLARSARFRPCGIGLFACLLLCVVIVTILGGDYLFSVGRNHKGGRVSFRSHDFFDNKDHSVLFSFWNMGTNGHGSTKDNTTDWGDDVGNGNWNSHDKRERALQFGKASVGNDELLDRDSRDWDKDDRRRDRYLDYESEDSGINTLDAELDSGIQFTGDTDVGLGKDQRTHMNTNTYSIKDGLYNVNSESEFGVHQDDTTKMPDRSGSLYNERGRKELQRYADEYEAALKLEVNPFEKKGASELGSRSWHKREKLDGNTVYKNADDDEAHANASTVLESNSIETSRTDKIIEDDNGYDEYDDTGDEDEVFDESGGDVEEEDSGKKSEKVLPDPGTDGLGLPNQEMVGESIDDSVEMKPAKVSVVSFSQDGTNKRLSQALRKKNAVQRRLSKRARQQRHTGYPCEIDFRDTTRGLAEPEANSRFANFTLKYIEFEDPQGITDWEPRFAGHQTLEQREQSFIATDQTIHCGFVQELGSSRTTGFDLAEDDMQFLSTCKIAVSSCIFGSSDNIRSPKGKKFTGSFKKDVCFVMFMDQRSLDIMKQEGLELDDRGYVGLWKVVVVRNMPFEDARRIGKIPKLLTHRLFPAARYSIWVDSKLRLLSDPVLILEHFLWRGGNEYAISNHYDRHCVWEEVQQNKKLNKYNHTVIDEQFAFYRADGLTKFNVSDPKKLLPSNVPEGSFIIRAHTPMSNLFSCLWFNEVDRFTPRDQLSFAYTYMKLVRTNPDKHFHLNMFKDCERKAMAKLFRHRRNVSSVIQSQLHIGANI